MRAFAILVLLFGQLGIVSRAAADFVYPGYFLTGSINEDLRKYIDVEGKLPHEERRAAARRLVKDKVIPDSILTNYNDVTPELTALKLLAKRGSAEALYLSAQLLRQELNANNFPGLIGARGALEIMHDFASAKKSKSKLEPALDEFLKHIVTENPTAARFLDDLAAYWSKLRTCTEELGG